MRARARWPTPDGLPTTLVDVETVSRYLGVSADYVYASFWVRKAMQELVAELTRPVALSDRAVRALAQVRTARGEYLQAHHTEPTVDQLSGATGFTPAQLESLQATERMPSPLEEPLGAETETSGTVGDAIVDPVAEQAYEHVLDMIEIREVRDVADPLDERERAVIRAHYGLLGQQTETLDQIGRGLGLTAERARQIEAGALAKMREALAPKGADQRRKWRRRDRTRVPSHPRDLGKAGPPRLPLYNPDDDAPTASAVRLIEACYGADGMLWSSPMYQGTISGAFKNALDWLHLLGDREPAFLHDKVIGLVSAAGGTQGLQAINTMEFATRALRAWAVPYVVPVAAAARVFDRDGHVQDTAVELQLQTLGGEVVRVAKRFADDASLHRAAECDHAAHRAATASPSTLQ